MAKKKTKNHVSSLRCALVCERLRCEPWRPWGWGETTRGPRRPARMGVGHTGVETAFQTPLSCSAARKNSRKNRVLPPDSCFFLANSLFRAPTRCLGGAPNREFRGRKQSVWRHQTAPRPAGSHLEEHTVGVIWNRGTLQGSSDPTRGQGPPVVRP